MEHRDSTMPLSLTHTPTLLASSSFILSSLATS